jgi:hypothetical protein
MAIPNAFTVAVGMLNAACTGIAVTSNPNIAAMATPKFEAGLFSFMAIVLPLMESGRNPD